VPPTVTDNPNEGRFELWVDGRLAGVSEYRPAGESLIVSHTEINREFEGRGLAGLLVREMLEELRRRGTTVIPLCDFTTEFIRRNPELVDVVLPRLQAQFRPRP
jgi:predicted GNAT family acetyltransferase